MHGAFCIGPDGSGCCNFKDGKPRRACYDNAGRCAHCRRSTCSISGCSRKALRSKKSRLCAFHSSVAAGILPRAALAASTFRKRSRHRCVVQWCPAPARRVRFSDDSPVVYVCGSHRRWFGPQDIKSGRGFRKGYLAAAASVDEYVYGRVPAARLSVSGTLDRTCTFCGALYFNAEAVAASRSSVAGRIFTRCCQRGAHASLPSLPDVPPLLASLLTGQPPDACSSARACLQGKMKTWPQLCRHFQDNIRAYNCALGFAAYADAQSVAYDTGKPLATSTAAAPPVYVLHGRVYHIAGTLYPPTGTAPKCSQLYVYDPIEATAHRTAAFPQLHAPLLRCLLDMLSEPVPSAVDISDPYVIPPLTPRNPYPAHFRTMHETVLAAQQRASRDGVAVPVHSLRFSGGVDRDPRTYSLPSSAEVACVVSGEGPLPKHFVSVYERADEDAVGTTHQLSSLSEHVDPLVYPLIHVDGTLGYSTALCVSMPAGDKVSFDRKISMAQFYAYRIMQRRSATGSTTELPHAVGRLFQQYIVDAYAKIESMRLDWIQNNQGALRLESLQGLLDHISVGNNLDISLHTALPSSESRTAGEIEDTHAERKCSPPLLGTPVILPCTFGGSPRALHQNYLDSMSLIARFGKPDLFLTATANPSWSEIQSNLRAGETAANRPDLVARVFRAKLRKLLDLITTQKVFGRSVAHTFVVEFQKRGLPHAHILAWQQCIARGIRVLRKSRDSGRRTLLILNH